MKKNNKTIKLAQLGPIAIGYVCPTCGMIHCKYEHCLRCGQPLSYDKEELDYTRRFNDVDEECRIRDAETGEQFNPFTGERIETLTEIRNRIKIDM